MPNEKQGRGLRVSGFCILLGIVAAAGTGTAAVSGGARSETGMIARADIDASTRIRLYFRKPDDRFKAFSPADFAVVPPVGIHRVIRHAGGVDLITDSLSLQQNYHLQMKDAPPVALHHAGILDSLYSDKPLGAEVAGGSTRFRLFAPRAIDVRLDLFRDYAAEPQQELQLTRDPDGVWESVVPRDLTGWYYAYRVAGPDGPGEVFAPELRIADPYGRAVVTRNTWRHEGRTLIMRDDYDWEGDSWVTTDRRDLVILEAHVRDLTAHVSAAGNPSLRGSYAGLLDPATRGGLAYIRDLGVNAVEFLPIQDFGNLEIPFKQTADGFFNTWNPYSRNHWGYMTSYFFAPETYYASGASLEPGGWADGAERAVREFRDVVKALHREGIAVILDVVYNHAAQYDQNCFKLADKKYYFRLNDDFTYRAQSGTGNDLKTERPMVRRLIVDSVRYWMQAYHIDGFRFDLAALLDWETIDAIREAATAINPNVVLIAEPWYWGKYAPAAFSDRGWAAWNDQIRNGVKGQNPFDGRGFIFSEWQGSNSQATMRRYVRGNLRSEGGLFQEASHAVNYLESHDDHTLGDFIRIASGAVDPEKPVRDVDTNAEIRGAALKMHKLAAIFLFASQGPVMISQGQDWGRSKIIAPQNYPETKPGTIDHNSYEKDDETNWLNFSHRDANLELVSYYRGLIRLRSAHALFRRSGAGQIAFLPESRGHVVAWRLFGEGGSSAIVILNGRPRQPVRIETPRGRWSVVVDAQRAGTASLRDVRGGETVSVPAGTGLVLLSANIAK